MGDEWRLSLPFFPVQCSEVYSVVTFGTSLSTTRIKWNHHQLRPAAINIKLRFSSTRKQADQQSFKLPESYYVSMIQQQYTCGFLASYQGDFFFTSATNTFYSQSWRPTYARGEQSYHYSQKFFFFDNTLQPKVDSLTISQRPLQKSLGKHKQFSSIATMRRSSHFPNEELPIASTSVLHFSLSSFNFIKAECCIKDFFFLQLGQHHSSQTLPVTTE